MKVSISYKQRFDNTANTKKIIESFGLTSEKEREIVTDLELPIVAGKLYYICGYSGSGKSSILNAVYEELVKQGKKVMYVRKWTELALQDLPLIEYFPEVTSEEKLKLLSKCGLGEAWKFVSRYTQLSDGEKFRFCLYYCVMKLQRERKESGVEDCYLIFDEFCSTLDRITAKAIAINMRRIRDQYGITFFLASAHEDLREHLKADYTLFKEFDAKVQVSEAAQK